MKEIQRNQYSPWYGSSQKVPGATASAYRLVDEERDDDEELQIEVAPFELNPTSEKEALTEPDQLNEFW